jgi:hypothetical protein
MLGWISLLSCAYYSSKKEGAELQNPRSGRDVKHLANVPSILSILDIPRPRGITIFTYNLELAQSQFFHIKQDITLTN